MKKLFTAMLVSSILTACGASKKSTKSELSKYSVVKDENDVYKIKPDATLQARVDKANSYIDKLVKKAGTKDKVTIATDNPYFANLASDLGIKLVGLTQWDSMMINSDLVSELQKMNLKQYSCKDFGEFEVKDGKCFVDGKETDVKPTKNPKYQAIDYRTIYNLGLWKEFDEAQLKKANPTGFVSVKDQISTKQSTAEEFELSFSFLDDYYVFLATFGKRLAKNKGQVDGYLQDLIENWQSTNEQIKKSKKPLNKVQFVIYGDDGELYSVTKESFASKLAKFYGFEQNLVGVKENAKKVNDDHIGFGFGQKISTKDKDAGADVMFIMVTKPARLKEGVDKALEHPYISNSKAYKNGKAVFVEDLQLLSPAAPQEASKVIDYIYDI